MSAPFKEPHPIALGFLKSHIFQKRMVSLEDLLAETMNNFPMDLGVPNPNKLREKKNGRND